MAINAGKYNSIFETDEWLNAVAGSDWERLEVKNKNGQAIASFPIVRMKQYGCRVLGTPVLTQTLGLSLEKTGGKLSKQLERDKKIINEIIEALPDGYSCDFNLDIDNKYILPFIWKGFRAEPRYSYRLENIGNTEEVWKGFRDNIKTDIRKAEKQVRVVENESIDRLIELQTKTFERQERKFPYDAEMIRRLDRMLVENDARQLVCAVDEEGHYHAAAYFVYDDKRCYYLMSGGDPEYRNSGATSLLVWEGIKKASAEGRIFDFEGSMIEDIERFMRAWGAQPRIYFHVMKYKSAYAIAQGIKPKIKKLLGYK